MAKKRNRLPSKLEDVTFDEYINRFDLERRLPYRLRRKDTQTARLRKAERAFEFVVETRKFEIDLYWKRAAYFWTFIAVTFGGYAAMVGSENPKSFQILIILCVGLLLSIAWYFSNLGSKKWQENWENHLDNFEDNFMGPLYKTINMRGAFSVSKVNEYVSLAFVFVWVILIGHNLVENYNVSWRDMLSVETAKVAVALAIPIMFTGFMLWDRFFNAGGVKKFEMFERKTPFGQEKENQRQ